MDGYGLVLLSEMVEEIGEEKTREVLSNFSCPLNKDVEDFLKNKAIPMIPQNKCPVHLVFSSYKKDPVLIGYYAVCVKTIEIPKGSVNRRFYERLAKFDERDALSKDKLVMSAPLIAQLGKNYYNGYNNLIRGDELLKLACDDISMVLKNVGGKVVYLECEPKEKLKTFYINNGFRIFNTRPMDKDEVDLTGGKFYLQMIKYMDIYSKKS